MIIWNCSKDGQTKICKMFLKFYSFISYEPINFEIPPDKTDKFVDTLVEKLVKRLKETLPVELFRYQKENGQESTSLPEKTSKPTPKPTPKPTSKPTTKQITTSKPITSKSVPIKKCAQDEMVTKVIFQKTHKTATSTVQNMLFRLREKRNLNFALPKTIQLSISCHFQYCNDSSTAQ